MDSQRPHPYVKIAGDDDMDAVNIVNNNSKTKYVNKTNSTRSKMATGSAISSTAPLNNVLGKRCAQMPVRFDNHETSQILGKRKSSAATNDAPPKSTSFYNHASSTSCAVMNRNAEKDKVEKVLPSSQSRKDTHPTLQSEAPSSSTKSTSSSKNCLLTAPVPLSADVDRSQTAGNGIDGVNTNSDASTEETGELNDEQQRPDNPICPFCKEETLNGQETLRCERCFTWNHKQCLNMSDNEYPELRHSETTPWFCARCLSIKSNQLNWGEYQGEEAIQNMIKSTYDNILSWKKNIFAVPRGNTGNKFITELGRLINLFVHKTNWERLSLSLVHIFLPIMLQKPSVKSKPRDNNKYLMSRLERWSDGNIKSLMSETNEIQRRMKKTLMRKEESRERAFVRLMMLGKIGPAAKYINNEDAVKGVHPLSGEIKDILQSKHPEARPIHQDTILNSDNLPKVEPVIFEEITAEKVQRTARNMKGSGGPTLVDSDTWKDFLCSKAFASAPQLQLCQAIADLAKRLCAEEIDPDCLVEYIACRLIPLDKGLTKDNKPGVRPIGVGEVLRRLVGKLLIGVIKGDIVSAAGPLQTCSGLRAGIEAAIHAMRIAFQNNNTEAILLVDAENAFNNLNREAALLNIKKLCPPFHRYLHNTYQNPAKLIIAGEKKYESLYSQEGSTQGDVTAMALYGIGIRPLIDDLSNTIDTRKCIQSWYADDSSTAGELGEMKKWWDELGDNGPKYV